MGGRERLSGPPIWPEVRFVPVSESGSSVSSRLLVDPVRQLEALADLLEMGLLSRDESERYKHQVQCL